MPISDGGLGAGPDLEPGVVDDLGRLVVDRDDAHAQDGRHGRLGVSAANEGEGVLEGVVAVVDVLEER